MSSFFNNESVEAQIDEAIAEWLREGVPHENIFAFDRGLLLHRIDLHGAGPALAFANDLSTLPDDLSLALRQRLIGREMWEEQHKPVLAQALEALTGAALKPILMKGTALAYSHYERPSLRPRGDSDILIEEEGYVRAFQALERAGFETTLIADGDKVISEKTYFKADAMGCLHYFDTHWRLSNSPVVSGLFGHEELLERSESISDLRANALRFGDIDSILFAAVHRRLHIDRPTHLHLNGTAYDVVDSLSWLRDIDILYNSMKEHTRQVMVQRALQKDVGDILLDALLTARDRLGTIIDDDVVRHLDQAKTGRIARYISAAPLVVYSMDLAAVHGWTTKIVYVSQLLFPPSKYVRSRFSKGHFDWLPVLYLRRALHGVRKLFPVGQGRSS